MTIHQDARVYAGLLEGTERAALQLAPGRRGYVHVARGEVTVDGQRLGAGDAAMITGSEAVKLADGAGAEVLAFDLP